VARELGLRLFVVLDRLRAVEARRRDECPVCLSRGVEMLLLEVEHRLLHALLVHDILCSAIEWVIAGFGAHGADRCSVASARISMKSFALSDHRWVGVHPPACRSSRA